MILERKYVLHVPLAKYADGKLTGLDIDDILDELYGQLGEKGFDVFYVSRVKGHYGSNIYDQLLITVFTSNGNEEVEKIFRKWFLNNNDVLCQKEFAYECCGQMTVEKLDFHTL